MMGEELVSNGKWIYICVGNQEVMFPGGAWSMEEIREELARGGKDHELLFACCACLQQVYVAPCWCCSAEVPGFLPVKHFCLMSSLNLSTCHFRLAFSKPDEICLCLEKSLLILPAGLLLCFSALPELPARQEIPGSRDPLQIMIFNGCH